MSSKFRAVFLLASFAENLPPLGEPTTSHHLLGEPRLLATNIVTAIPFRVDVKKWSNLAPKTKHQTKTKTPLQYRAQTTYARRRFGDCKVKGSKFTQKSEAKICPKKGKVTWKLLSLPLA